MCNATRELSFFGKCSKNKDSLRYFCKECEKLVRKEYQKTKASVIVDIYNGQKQTSKKRGHNPPTYTKQELSQWLLNDWLFNLLYDNWINCGYIKDMKPSVDRLNDSKGYSFDNVQIMTWAENRAKQSVDIKSGKLIRTYKPLKAVFQFTTDDEFIQEFISVHEASRQTDICYQNISKCCNGKRKSSGGFIWKFSNKRKS